MTVSGMPFEDAAAMKNSFTIGADGTVNIPYAGMVRAAGLTQSQLEQAIQRKLIDEKIFRWPTVTINVGGAQVRYVTVGGQVRNPTRLQWSADLTLLSALSASGGPSDFGGDKVTLTRGGRSTQYSVKKLKRNPTNDPRLLPGDLVELL
jgi:polysaccharide export outer membrane protein